MSEEEIEIKSEEIQDILTRVPHKIIRLSNTFFVTFIFTLVFLSCIVEYPNVITAEIIITSENPPEKLVAKTSGKIQKIFIKNNHFVYKNTPLAIIENSANDNDVFLLKSIVDTVEINNTNFKFPLEKLPTLSLGTIQSAYAEFEKDYIVYKLNKNLNPYQIDITAQNTETLQQQQRLDILINQKEFIQKEFNYKNKELERNKNLYKKGMISTQEWEYKNIEYLQYEKNINNINSQILQLHSSLNYLTQSKKSTILNQNKENVILLKNAIISFNQLKKSINEWEMNFVLRSSIFGKVSFMKIWSENQNVNVGETIFVIIPEDITNYIGKAKATTFNSGKIKIGQEVNIRLESYPDYEFGIIKGNVNSFSLISDKENYLFIDVILPSGLETSYNKQIIFQQEMSGTADIITEKSRLIEKLFHRFRNTKR